MKSEAQNNKHKLQIGCNNTDTDRKQLIASRSNPTHQQKFQHIFTIAGMQDESM